MAPFKQYIFIIVCLIFIQETTTVDIGSLTESIFDGFRDLVNKVESTVCLHINRGEFAQCSKVTRFQSGIDSVKDYCCSLMELRKCIEGVAKLHCGNDAQKTIKILLDSTQKGSSKNCDLYNSYFDCIDPIFILAMFAGICALFIWCICAVFDCLKRAFCNAIRPKQ